MLVLMLMVEGGDQSSGVGEEGVEHDAHGSLGLLLELPPGPHELARLAARRVRRERREDRLGHGRARRRADAHLLHGAPHHIDQLLPTCRLLGVAIIAITIAISGFARWSGGGRGFEGDGPEHGGGEAVDDARAHQALEHDGRVVQTCAIQVSDCQ